MKNTAIIFVLAVITTMLLGRAPDIEWARCYGGSSEERAISVIQAEDGNFIVAGYSRSTNGSFHLN